MESPKKYLLVRNRGIRDKTSRVFRAHPRTCGCACHTRVCNARSHDVTRINVRAAARRACLGDFFEITLMGGLYPPTPPRPLWLPPQGRASLALPSFLSGDAASCFRWATLEARMVFVLGRWNRCWFCNFQGVSREKKRADSRQSCSSAAYRRTIGKTLNLCPASCRRPGSNHNGRSD